jgi:hypothetical protein
MAEQADARFSVYMTEYEAVCLGAYATSSIEDAEEHMDQLDPEDQATTKSDIAAVRRVLSGLKDIYEPQDPERESRFWNVGDVLATWSRHNSYTDFEGFANPGPVARLVRSALNHEATDQPVLASTTYIDGVDNVDATDLNTFIRDVLLHYCYETADQAGAEFLPSAQELQTAAHILSYVFNGSARFMKVAPEDYQKALDTPEDEEEDAE